MERMTGWWQRSLGARRPMGQTACAVVMTLALCGAAYAGEDDLGIDLDFGAATVLDDNELAGNSGGTEIDIGDIGINVATNNATLSGNSVDGTVTTGKITDNALNDVSGINSLMYNTGNNVNFQSNMQINVFLK